MFRGIGSLKTRTFKFCSWHRFMLSVFPALTERCSFPTGHIVPELCLNILCDCLSKEYAEWCPALSASVTETYINHGLQPDPPAGPWHLSGPLMHGALLSSPIPVSLFVLRVVLEDIGRPAEAHGEMKVRCSVALPEEGTSMAELLAESAEKLPSTALVGEFKASAVKVNQKYTIESWERLDEVGKKLMKSPEFKNTTIPNEDQVYVVRLAVLLKLIFMGLLLNYFQAYF